MLDVKDDLQINKTYINVIYLFILQYREFGCAQFACVRLEHNSSKRVHKGFGQRVEDQDMAGWDGVGVQHFLREHPDGEREELCAHRSILLPDKGMQERDVGRVPNRRNIQEHKGHLRREEPPDTLRLQRQRGVHEHHHVRSRAPSARRGFGRRPLLLERLWCARDAHHTSHRLFAGWDASNTS